MPRIALAVVTLALAGCGGSVELGVPAGPHVAGTELPLEIRNDTGREVQFGLCEVEMLERLGDAGWEKVAAPGSEFCLAVGYSVGPFATSKPPFFLPADLPAGTYRLVDVFEFADWGKSTGEFTSAQSASFEVAAAP